MDKLILVADLGDELGLERSYIRRYIYNLGIQPTKVKDPEAGNQLVLAVNEQEARKIRRSRELTGLGKTGSNRQGLFYVVCPDPEARPGRVKLGFTSNLKRRVRDHRTGSPELKVIKTWPCQASWEAAAIAAITKDATRLTPEVFDCDDMQSLLKQASAFFDMMPSL